MFVYTIKWSKGMAVAILLLLAIILALITCAVSNSGRTDETAGSSQDVAAYLESLGWAVDEENAAERQVIIPTEFSEVYSRYNELQKSQGFDLSEYCGQSVTIYTFPIINYSGYSGSVVAEVYTAHGRIIGGDMHSLELDGFMTSLSRKGK